MSQHDQLPGTAPNPQDITALREQLRELIESDNPDPAHPLYPQYLAYLELIEAQAKAVKVHEYRGAADPLVSDSEAMAVKRLTGLVPDADEYMVIHTKEAYRAFTGRARSPDGSYERIVGGRKAAASLKVLYYLTGNDNPYADWALINMADQMAEIDALFGQEIARFDREMKRRQREGLHYALLRSPYTQKVDLGFRSPYGFRVAELLVRFDTLVRHVKTMNYRSMMTDAEAYGISHQYVRRLRRLFLAPLRFEAVLMQEKAVGLRRADFLDDASIEGRQRVGHLLAIFGKVPQDILVGVLQPQYGKRRSTLTAEEQRQLRALQAVPIDAEPTAGEERALL